MTTPIQDLIKAKLRNRAVFYVCRDIERALGVVPDDSWPYFIITNSSEYAKEMAEKLPNIMLVKNNKILDTWQLLENSSRFFPLIGGRRRWGFGQQLASEIPPLYPEYSGQASPLKGEGNDKKRKRTINANDYVLVFKNTSLIEKICRENKWKLLNPSAELAKKVEEKISQVNWLGKLARCLPPHKITTCKKIKWSGEKFILQFNLAHTGEGTILIKNKKELEEIKTKFPNREAKITKFIDGPVFTSNNVVNKSKILIGNISFQITGLKSFTENPFATIGNDWSLPRKILSSKQISTYKKMVTDVGNKLAEDGWRGLFGVDIIMDEKTKKMYLLEINARQPASATFESQLQCNIQYPISNITIFEAHLASLFGIDLAGYKLIPITNGAQIIFRVPSGSKITQTRIANMRKKLYQLGFNIISYDNPKPGAELLRIQSNNGIMKSPKQFTALGRLVKQTLANK